MLSRRVTERNEELRKGVLWCGCLQWRSEHGISKLHQKALLQWEEGLNAARSGSAGGGGRGISQQVQHALLWSLSDPWEDYEGSCFLVQTRHSGTWGKERFFAKIRMPKSSLRQIIAAPLSDQDWKCRASLWHCDQRRGRHLWVLSKSHVKGHFLQETGSYISRDGWGGLS